VKQYTEPGWTEAPFVHCSHGSLYPNGKKPRWKFVREIMEAKA
jgi:hypothetical protein